MKYTPEETLELGRKGFKLMKEHGLECIRGGIIYNLPQRKGGCALLAIYFGIYPEKVFDFPKLVDYWKISSCLYRTLSYTNVSQIIAGFDVGGRYLSSYSPSNFFVVGRTLQEEFLSLD